MMNGLPRAVWLQILVGLCIPLALIGLASTAQSAGRADPQEILVIGSAKIIEGNVAGAKDRALSDAIVQSGERTHERCWPMPMPDDYLELMKSDHADINNISSSRSGGAITAALFLAEFVDKARWAHIDIAGPAYAKKGSAYCGPGGTGFGVRLLVDLLTHFAF